MESQNSRERELATWPEIAGLRVIGITTEPALTDALAPKATPDERRKIVWKTFGRVATIKNILNNRRADVPGVLR